MSGHKFRREKFFPMLCNNIYRVPSCYAYRQRINHESDAEELESILIRLGPETVIGFVCEPVMGPTLGCVLHFPRLPICDEGRLYSIWSFYSFWTRSYIWDGTMWYFARLESRTLKRTRNQALTVDSTSKLLPNVLQVANSLLRACSSTKKSRIS